MARHRDKEDRQYNFEEDLDISVEIANQLRQESRRRRRKKKKHREFDDEDY